MEILALVATVAVLATLGGALRYSRYRAEARLKSAQQSYEQELIECELLVKPLLSSEDARIKGCLKVAIDCLTKAKTALEFKNPGRSSVHLRCAQTILAWAKELNQEPENDEDGRFTNLLLEAVYHIRYRRVELARKALSEFRYCEDCPFAVTLAEHNIEILCLFLEGQHAEAAQLAEDGPTFVVNID